MPIASVYVEIPGNLGMSYFTKLIYPNGLTTVHMFGDLREAWEPRARHQRQCQINGFINVAAMHPPFLCVRHWQAYSSHNSFNRSLVVLANIAPNDSPLKRGGVNTTAGMNGYPLCDKVK